MDNNNNMVNPLKTKTNKGLKIALACTSVLAAAGIGFGIWGVLSNINNDNKSNNADNSDTTTVTKETKTDKKTKKEEKISETTNPSTTDIDGYFVLADWGIKVKIPDGFQITGAIYTNTDDPDTTLGSYAFTGQDSGAQMLPAYADIKKCQLGYLSAFKGTPQIMVGSYEEVFKKGDITFVYESPQASCSLANSLPNDVNYETKAAEKIGNMLKTGISNL